MTCTIVLDYDSEENVYNVSVPPFPECYAWGKTKAQAVKRTKEVIAIYRAALADFDAV